MNEPYDVLWLCSRLDVINMLTNVIVMLNEVFLTPVTEVLASLWL